LEVFAPLNETNFMNLHINIYTVVVSPWDFDVGNHGPNPSRGTKFLAFSRGWAKAFSRGWAKAGGRTGPPVGWTQALLDLVAEVGRRASGPRVESEWIRTAGPI
jgi:hypothetical protein